LLGPYQKKSDELKSAALRSAAAPERFPRFVVHVVLLLLLSPIQGKKEGEGVVRRWKKREVLLRAKNAGSEERVGATRQRKGNVPKVRRRRSEEGPCAKTTATTGKLTNRDSHRW